MNSDSSLPRAKKYAVIKTRIFLADILVTVLSLAVFQLFLSAWVKNVAYWLFPGFYPACMVYSTIFLLYMYITSFPLNVLSSFWVERRFSLSTQSAAQWCVDELKSGVLSYAMSIGCLVVFYFILRNFPVEWWVVVSVAWILFTIIMARLLPVLLIPIFYKYSPVEDSILKKRIMSLAKRSGVPLANVCQIDLSRKTRKANAALVGLGSTRKVILGDTLVKEFSPGETETVVAHELAHLKYNHIWKLLFFSGCVTFLGFFLLSRLLGQFVIFLGAEGPSDLYMLPVLVFLLVAFSMAIMPFHNFISRALERQADRFALDMCGETDTFVSVMKKLAELNLAEEDPSLIKKIFLYDHPPLRERISMAEGIREELRPCHPDMDHGYGSSH